MEQIEQALSGLNDVATIVRKLRDDLKSTQQKLETQRNRNAILSEKNTSFYNQLRNKNTVLSENEKFKEEIKNLKEGNKELSRLLKYQKTCRENATKELEDERKKVKELEKEISKLKSKPVPKRKSVDKKVRSYDKTPDTPYKASTKVGKREIVIGYFATSEMAREAERNAQNIL